MFATQPVTFAVDGREPPAQRFVVALGFKVLQAMNG